MKEQRINLIKKKIDNRKCYVLTEALEFYFDCYKKSSQAKFDETIECIVKLGIKTQESNHMVQGHVVVPHGFKKSVRVMAIVEETQIKAANEQGADFVGNDIMIEKIQNGFTDFDVCITTPNMMTKVAKLAKKIGPKGLMPNLNFGTVTTEIAQTISDYKNGVVVTFKADKSGIVHVPIGKMRFNVAQVKQNILSFFNTLLKAKPDKIKNHFITSMFICSTQGPSLKLDLKSFLV